LPLDERHKANLTFHGPGWKGHSESGCLRHKEPQTDGSLLYV
jgi:hypothetical protein